MFQLTKYSMEQSPWEAHSHLASQEILLLLWNTRFITVFTRACHWSLCWARCIQSTPFHTISLRSTLILYFHLRLGFPSGIFPSKILYAFFHLHSRILTNWDQIFGHVPVMIPKAPNISLNFIIRTSFRVSFTVFRL